MKVIVIGKKKYARIFLKRMSETIFSALIQFFLFLNPLFNNVINTVTGDCVCRGGRAGRRGIG
jgi:hypothetical protein